MYCTDQKIKCLWWPNIKRGEHRNTGLASAESAQLVETEYMSEEGINSPDKTTSIKESKGKWKKRIFRERCSQRKSGEKVEPGDETKSKQHALDFLCVESLVKQAEWASVF